MRSEWELWKFGAKALACVGIGAFAAYCFAALIVGVVIVMPVELITGSDAIEEYIDVMIAVVAVAVAPSFAAFMLERNGVHQDSK